MPALVQHEISRGVRGPRAQSPQELCECGGESSRETAAEAAGQRPRRGPHQATLGGQRHLDTSPQPRCDSPLLTTPPFRHSHERDQLCKSFLDIF